MTVDLSHIRTWVFDLDRTLYHPNVRLFDQIEARMESYVMHTLGVDQTTARQIRRQYWEKHGTTLAGLMEHHGTDPHAFLDHVHDIDFTPLTPDPNLAAIIAALPGRKVIYTNGTVPYARNVIKARGLADVFDAIYGVEDAHFRPKPERAAFDAVFGRDGFNQQSAVMFEDEARNLEVPKTMGMGTIHISETRSDAPYIDHRAPDVMNFLTQHADFR
ncbi:MAG: pyrimidine 5'-nucleotidase [Planktomarina sp.]